MPGPPAPDWPPAHPVSRPPPIGNRPPRGFPLTNIQFASAGPRRMQIPAGLVGMGRHVRPCNGLYAQCAHPPRRRSASPSDAGSLELPGRQCAADTPQGEPAGRSWPIVPP
ncbi:hypothetical protein FRC08_000389 [Ceratobasidium sp. 394]|nr:hypothetical protein FRC08_000389 [Ceratobasidium sp. 394]